MKFLTILFSLFCVLYTLSASPDLRPAFDKSSYLGTMWTQVNPWWVANKPRTGNPLGGANYARKFYPEDAVECWKTAMEECQAKGMTGWQFELVVHTPGYGYTCKEVIKAAEQLDNFKIAFFLTWTKEELSEAKRQLLRQFEIFEDEYRNSEVIFRIDGAPVIVAYTPWSYTPEEWQELIGAFEARYGKAIWLMNFWDNTYVPETKPDELRKYLPVFDGCTAYANWGSQDELYRLVSEVMKNEYPQKIFEGTVHNTYSNHYLHSGIFTEVSRKFRASWESMQDCRPDSIVLTNLFDHWENSLFLPCYEREDFLLRYGEFQMQQLYGTPVELKKTPEIVVTSYIDMAAGFRDLLFEVTAFPIDSAKKSCTCILELLDESGNVIHTFPAVNLTLDKVQTEEFSLPSARFAGRLVIPRLQYSWQGEPQPSLLLPPTWIDPALRGNLMWWARSTTNAIYADKGIDWTLNSYPAGSVVDWYETCGKGSFEAPISAPGITTVRILRNGEEFYSARADKFEGVITLDLPCPTLNDDYYWLEMENINGDRLNTLPMWVTSQKYKDMVATVIPDGHGNYLPTELPPGRIPVFYYPCIGNTGSELIDIGGLNHNGKYQQESVGYAYGSLTRAGYRHYTDSAVNESRPELFGIDPDGRGFIPLRDKSFFMINSGTAFPFSGTYEISIRPESTGEKMGIMDTVNGALNVSIEADGHLRVARGMAAEGEAGSPPHASQTVYLRSREPLAAGEWVKIAVVYDCSTLKLYLNGELQDEAEGLPNPDHFAVNYVAVGCNMHFLHSPFEYFTGDIRQIRLTGRPLLPWEFL